MARRSRGESPSTSVSINVNETAYGKGFPVGKSVCGCYLKSIKLKKDTDEKGVEYHKALFHFVKNDKWVTKYIAIKPREMFKYEKAYEKAKFHAFESLVNIAACYITKSHLKKVNFNTKGLGIKGYMDELIKALEDKQYWNKPVCLKTVPREDGGVNVAKYIHFIKPDGRPCNWELRYNHWENEQYTKFLIKNKNND